MIIIKTFILFLLSNGLFATEYRCGMSEGYAPFQYLIKNFKSGLDVEIVKLFNKIGPDQIKISSGNWDNLVSELYHTKGIDCLIGTEKTVNRKFNFSFSIPLYKRETSIVVLSSSKIGSIGSLSGKIVCGDKDSDLEGSLIKLPYAPMRLRYMESKLLCMKALSEGIVSAVIMPSKVSKFLAKTFGVKIKEIPTELYSVDVAFAFKKKGSINLERFNSQLKSLMKTKSFKDLLKRY